MRFLPSLVALLPALTSLNLVAASTRRPAALEQRGPINRLRRGQYVDIDHNDVQKRGSSSKST